MQKSKTYPRLRFAVSTVQAAFDKLNSERLKEEGKEAHPQTMSVEVDGADWKHDTLPEFWADYRRGGACRLHVYGDTASTKQLFVEQLDEYRTRVTVTGPSRAWVESLFEVFEGGLSIADYFSDPPKPPLTPEPPPTVFIGHGRSQQWRDLQDHLRDKQGVTVVAFESGARAGHAIRDILEDMTARSSIAFLVLTAEDEADDGTRARQNVVHELGVCQGKLGFNRGIALVEEGVTMFSNLDGIQQIRFSKANIRETFGEVLATIRREFPPKD